LGQATNLTSEPYSEGDSPLAKSEFAWTELGRSFTPWDQSGRDATVTTTGSVPIPRLARALALRARFPAGLYAPPPFPHCPPFTSHHPHAPGWIWLLRMASRVTVEEAIAQPKIRRKRGGSVNSVNNLPERPVHGRRINPKGGANVQIAPSSQVPQSNSRAARGGQSTARKPRSQAVHKVHGCINRHPQDSTKVLTIASLDVVHGQGDDGKVR